jgi:hypothetical protein
MDSLGAVFVVGGNCVGSLGSEVLSGSSPGRGTKNM